MMESERIKKDFPIFDEGKNLCYLDNAASSHKPRNVIKSIKEFYEKDYSSVGRGIYDLSNQATLQYRKARKKVADHINADQNEIVFVRNTTEAENLLAESLKFEGDIVLSEMAHHSEQLPWRRKSQNEDKNVKYIETSNGKISIESAKEKITEDTGLIAISHISNVYGAENPVKKITEYAKSKNAYVVLDAAQSVPHKPIDVKELNVDFLCFSGHKMLGPQNIGVLYGKSNLLNKMQPYQVGGGMIKSVKKQKVSYKDSPSKFEAGTENVVGAIGLKSAINYLEQKNKEKVYNHTKKISKKIRQKIRHIDGIQVISPKQSTIVSFTTDYAHPHDIAEVLNQEKICIRAGNHCAQPLMEKLGISGTLRASPYIYNTEKDAEKLAKTLKKSRDIF